MTALCSGQRSSANKADLFNMAVCTQCGKSLSHNEIGLFKRLVNRDSTEFLCLECLAKAFRVPEERLKEKIREYIRQGCTLFTEE